MLRILVVLLQVGLAVVIIGLHLLLRQGWRQTEAKTLSAVGLVNATVVVTEEVVVLTLGAAVGHHLRPDGLLLRVLAARGLAVVGNQHGNRIIIRRNVTSLMLDR